MPQYFTRSRKLSFLTVFTIILRNSIKSLQLMLNEFVLSKERNDTITASAFSQARKKLKHTVFIDLNEQIISLYYQDKEIQKYHGMRILAIDGSKLTLPKTEEIKHVFGSRAISNQTRKDFSDYSRATFEGCYDVLNNIAVKSVLGGGNCYEVDLAKEILSIANEDDLLIFDRGYAAYPFFARLIGKKINYLIRCPKISFDVVQSMFKEDSPSSIIASINVPLKHRKTIREGGLPLTIKLRLVRVILPSGEIEVLATSLMDEKKFPTKMFAELYYLRWSVETFFSKLKGRLCLENFTGNSVEAIRQDFWSTIFMSNLETILVEDIEEEINSKVVKNNHTKKINKAVSFNAIKNLAFDILSTKIDEDEIISKLTKLFLTNPFIKREGRTVARHKISDTRSLNFQKRFRKHVF